LTLIEIGQAIIGSVHGGRISDLGHVDHLATLRQQHDDLLVQAGLLGAHPSAPKWEEAMAADHDQVRGKLDVPGASIDVARARST